MPTGREWIATYTEDLGAEPLDDVAIDTILEIAGVAAHASERIAAPVACYLAGRMGIDLQDALARARELA